VKICGQCHERYHDHVDFCFVDGEVLVFDSTPAPRPSNAASGHVPGLDDYDAPPPPSRMQGQQTPSHAPQTERTASKAPSSAREADDDAPLRPSDQITLPIPNPAKHRPNPGKPAPVYPPEATPAPVEPTPGPAYPTPTPPPARAAQAGPRRRPAAEAASPRAEAPTRSLGPLIAVGVALALLLIGGAGAVAMLGGTAVLFGAGASESKHPVAVNPAPRPAPVVAPVEEPVPAPEVAPAAVPSPEPEAAVAPVPAPTPTHAPSPVAAPTAAPAPALAIGKVSISSVPAGAELRADGRSAGKTPTHIELPLGVHSLALALQGYEPWTGSVDVNGAAVTVPAIKLLAIAAPPAAPGAPAPAAAPAVDVIPARTGKVFLSSVEAGAKVWVDGKLSGELPLTLELPGGHHTFKVVGSTGEATYDKNIVLKDAGTTPVFLGPE
jgi:hypothetical protein